MSHITTDSKNPTLKYGQQMSIWKQHELRVLLSGLDLALMSMSSAIHFKNIS